MELTLVELLLLRNSLDCIHVRLSDERYLTKSEAMRLLISARLKENQNLYEKISVEIERRKD